MRKKSAETIIPITRSLAPSVEIARDALARNGNPPPEFRVEPHMVIATVRPRPPEG